ncbi:immunoglobulin domain-containing protein [Filimonas effusa]|uniref:Ig-like domain-containing protein n=1 Tax=Filimonas effusa TaxID=2508721 RepID=A0A4Q1D5B6_9BACT|nr:hypothetical protein [Filimonas effusa]RXK83558.1 hypothetical protein ESB13_15830 [Filimonas effusa]
MRRYADMQKEGRALLGLRGTLTSAAAAADNDPATYSTLSVTLSALGLINTTQFLQFTTNGTTPRDIPANTPVTIKFSMPAGLLGLVNGIEIGSFTGLADNNNILYSSGAYATAPTAIYTSVDLANVLSGTGNVELTVTPAQIYNGVYVKLLGGVLGAGLSLNLFGAYILEDAPGNINCDQRMDVLYGSDGLIGLNAATVLGAVNNPYNSIDADANYTTYAELNAAVQALGYVYLTPVFPTASDAGDSVQIVLQYPGSLLTLSLLNGLSIQPYLGSAAAGSELTAGGGLLSLRLLNGSTDKYILTMKVGASFDRVQIRIAGLLNVALGGALRIYDVSRIQQRPQSSLTINTTPTPSAFCLNQSSGFAVNVTGPQNCTVYTWYDAANNPVSTGVSANGQTFTPVITTAGDYNYTIKASRSGCNNTAASSPISYTIYPTPATPVVPPVTVCTGQSATLTLSNPVTSMTYRWYSTASGGTPLSNSISSGTSFTTGTPPAFTTYYVDAHDASTQCTSDSRGQGTITIVPHPGPPSLSIQPN